jgi:hypothetical protein
MQVANAQNTASTVANVAATPAAMFGITTVALRVAPPGANAQALHPAEAHRDLTTRVARAKAESLHVREAGHTWSGPEA